MPVLVLGLYFVWPTLAAWRSGLPAFSVDLGFTPIWEVPPGPLVAAATFVPPPLMEFSVEGIDARACEICIHRCFVHESVVRAGCGADYVCAVFDRIRGWHEGLNLPLAGEPPALPCAKVQGRPCRRRLTIQQED